MSTSGTMLNRRILVIDDNPAIHEDFCRILQTEERTAGLRDARALLFDDIPQETTEEDFEVDYADQGQTGLVMVQRALQQCRPYAVAFVDMRMPPGWDGVETLEHLWRVDPDLQAVLCTAFADLDWDYIIHRLGRSDQLLILRKPFDVVEAWQLARALTQKWTLAQYAKHRLDTLAELVEQRAQALREVNARLERDIVRRQQVEADLQQAQAELEQRVAERTAALQREIAERQQAEAQLRQQQDVLFQHEKLAAMGTLLASVAHELNNPLAIIMMQADILHEERQDDAQAEPVKAITQAAERCMRIVRNFLTLVRQHAPERQAVALNTVVEGAMELVAYGLQVDTITVDWQLAPDLPLLWADPHQLHQVIVNLVTNAQHALREVPPPRRLTLTTRYDPVQLHVVLEVADTGPGIPPAVHAQIFEPFFTTKPSGVGTGLGLPLCRGIIEGHGGNISVQSQPGQGTVFRIALPMQAAGSPGGEPTQMKVSLPVDVTAQTILVVDDEPAIARALAQLLRRDGHTVDTAANGQLALIQLRTQAYDLLLCDLRMPGLDGLGLYQVLQQQHPYLLSRVIFLTGDTMSAEARTFLEQAGVPRLSKPFRAEEVRRLVSQVLQDTRV